MKNKKGVTTGRILLYILFICLLGFFIYIIACTFKAIKDKQPTNTYTHEVINKVYNNQFDYSGADFLQRSYLNFYKSNDFVRDNSFINSHTQDLATVNTRYNYNSSYVMTAYFPGVETSSVSLRPYYVNCSVSDNVYHISTDIKDLADNASNTSVEYSNGDIENVNFFNEFYSDFNSCALIIECDIPISIFNFTWSNNHSAFEGFDFWLQGDVGGIYRAKSFLGYSFNGDVSLPDFILGNCSKVTKMIIPLWQDVTSYLSGFYFPNGANPYGYNYYYDKWFTNSFSVDFTFDIFTATSDFQEGYNAGYADGVNNADSALQADNIYLREQVSILNYDISQLTSRVEQQTIIINQLQEQINTSNNNFKGLFFTMADIPFKTVSNALGFEFWGINLFKFFVGIITALGIVWLIKRIL